MRVSHVVMSKKIGNIIVLFVACPLSGLIANFIPVIISHPNDYRFGFPPLVYAFADEGSITAILLLLIVGLISAYFSTVKPWKIGLAIVILMPIMAIAETTVNPESHNLLPIEIVITYPYMTLFGAGSAFLGKLLKKKIKTEAKEIEPLF